MSLLTRFFISCFLFIAACGAPQQQVKPIASADLVENAKPRIELYLIRAFVGKDYDGKTVGEVKLIDAKLFSEGFSHETWKLDVEVGGELAEFVLKIYPNWTIADRDADNYRQAGLFKWPVPKVVLRDTAEPYRPFPALLTEYVPGETLSGYIKNKYRNVVDIPPKEIADLYKAVGRRLGELHRFSKRPRQADDVSGKAHMEKLILKCEVENWCGPKAVKRFKSLADDMDKEEVTFVHGDLYESQMVVNEYGRVEVFLDLDHAGCADPAWDVGSMLGQISVINPLAREAYWKVKNPTAEEVKQSAESFLVAYKTAAGYDGEKWKEFVARVKAYMWLRVGQVIMKLRNNPHADPFIKILDNRKVALFIIDPFEEYGITF